MLPLDNAMDREVVERVGHALSLIDEREADVLRRHFGLEGRPQTLAEIGPAMGVSRERIRQIEASALEHLREPRVACLPDGLIDAASGSDAGRATSTPFTQLEACA